MKYIIPVAEFNPSGRNCVISSLYNVLSYYGSDISEADIFYLCDGFNYGYITEYRFALGYFVVADLITQLTKSGIVEAEFYLSPSADFFAEEVFKSLKSNKPVILISYANSFDYNKEVEVYSNRAHAVVIYGIDVEDGYLYVGDSNLIDIHGDVLTYMGKISLDKVKENIIGFSLLDIKNNKIEHRDRYLADIKDSILDFLHGVKINENEYRKFWAFKRWHEDIQYICELEGAKFTEACMIIHFSIKLGAIIPMLNYLLFLLEENEELQVQDYNLLINKIKENIVAWNNMSLIVLKAGICINRSKCDKIIYGIKDHLQTLEKLMYEFAIHIGNAPTLSQLLLTKSIKPFPLKL